MSYMFLYLNDKFCGKTPVDSWTESNHYIKILIDIINLNGDCESCLKKFMIRTRRGETDGYLYDKTLDINKDNRIFIIPKKKSFWDNVEI